MGRLQSAASHPWVPTRTRQILNPGKPYSAFEFWGVGPFPEIQHTYRSFHDLTYSLYLIALTPLPILLVG